jgi:hypothetical protein
MADKATAVSYRYGERGPHSQFRGVKGEITVDITTPTVWVHTGDQTKPGTPLAREDLDNVTQTAIAAKGIAKTDLTNVSITDVTTTRGKLAALNYAQRDLSDITTTAYTTLDNTYARNTLANVNKISITSILDGESESENAYAKYDLSNITQAKLADKGLAKTNLDNVTAATIKGKGIASNTLDNVTLNDATRTSLDLQKVSNLISVSDANVLDNGTYPTAYSVRNELDSIPPMITNIVVDTLETSQTVGQITINVSKTLIRTPVVKNINSQIISGTWVNSSANVWVFTPADGTAAAKILNESWVITLV